MEQCNQIKDVVGAAPRNDGASSAIWRNYCWETIPEQLINVGSILVGLARKHTAVASKTTSDTAASIKTNYFLFEYAK